MAFKTVLINVLLILAYMCCGFFITKAKKAESSHGKTLSGILLYICCPCMIISSFQSMEYSMDNFRKSMEFLGVSLLVQLLFFMILYVILRKKFSISKYRILSIGAILGNVGFFGLPVVTGLFPDEPVVACYSTLYVTSMNLLVFTIGVFMITNDKKYVSVKAAVLNPTTISVLIAIPLYLMKFQFPEMIGTTISFVGKMSTPLCMFVLGMRLASMSFKAVFGKPFAYAVCGLKLIAFPLFVFLCTWFLPFFDTTFKTCLYVLSSAPSGAVILSLAELHGCEQKLSANVVLMTTLFSVLTMPLMLLIIS